MPHVGASTSTSATNKRSSNCSGSVSTWEWIRNPVTGEKEFKCTSAHSIELSRDGRRYKTKPSLLGPYTFAKAKDKPKVDQVPKAAGITQKLGSNRIPFLECQTKEDLHDELLQAMKKSSHANFRGFYSIIDVEHDHKRRVEEIASELRKVEGLSFSIKHYQTKEDPQHTFYFAKYRLQGYDLPLIAVKKLVDAFLLASNELLLSLQELCQPLEEDDPARLELIAYYESQVDGWANESIDKVEAWLKPPPPTPPSGSDSLARAHRPYLEEYLKTNAYPSTADKKTLAECEGISVRQVHVWFQNRRARARECGLSLPYVPRASTSRTHTRYASTDSGDKRWWGVAGDDGRGGLSSSSDKQPSRRHSPYILPAASRATRAPLKSHFDGRSRSSRSSRHRKRTRVADVEELPAAFCAMNVRQPGHDEASAKGYAACDAITYVLPKAPLPSLVPTAPYVDPNVVSTSYSVRADGNGRRPSGSPRRTESSRSRDSWGLPEPVSSASPPSRKPSLTFSDTSSASSSGPESPPELRPSSVSDSASPISTTTCRSSLPQTDGRDHDDVDLCEEYQPYPLSPPDANTSVSLAEPCTPFDQFSGSNNPYSLQSSIGLQSPALFTTSLEIPADLCAAGDSNVLAQLFGEGSTATMKDGVIALPNLDEYTFPDLEIDPNAPAGPVDIQPVSWDLDLGSLANLAPETSQGWDATTGALGWSSDGTWYHEPRNWLGDVAAAAMPSFATSWTPAACVAAF
ncbi:hypothetical protein FB107DRAFT_269620 [Schizophyllum commune]